MRDYSAQILEDLRAWIIKQMKKGAAQVELSEVERKIHKLERKYYA